MTKRLSATLTTLIYEAALASFNRHAALSRFLRQVGIAEDIGVRQQPDETKRSVLDRVFGHLNKAANGQDLLLHMGRELAAQETFPDLLGYEDSKERIAKAYEAVGALRRAISKVDEQVTSERDRKAARDRLRQMQQESVRSRQTIETLNTRLTELAMQIGTREGGVQFQDWFFDLMGFFEISNRRPYKSAGREIDGSITVSGTTYLIELKFTARQTDAPEIDSITKKVLNKADNTMGIVISMSGYSTVAVKEASGPRTPILLMDHSHIYCCLAGVMTFTEIVERIRRHASQTGEALLSPDQF